MAMERETLKWMGVGLLEVLVFACCTLKWMGVGLLEIIDFACCTLKRMGVGLLFFLIAFVALASEWCHPDVRLRPFRAAGGGASLKKRELSCVQGSSVLYLETRSLLKPLATYSLSVDQFC